MRRLEVRKFSGMEQVVQKKPMLVEATEPCRQLNELNGTIILKTLDCDLFSWVPLHPPDVTHISPNSSEAWGGQGSGTRAVWMVSLARCSSRCFASDRASTSADSGPNSVRWPLLL